MSQLSTSFKVGWFLGIRQLRRASKWTTGLIVFIMTLTFLNLVVVSGILIGLIVGGNIANRQQFTGDVILTTPYGKTDISRSQEILATLRSNEHISQYSERFIKGGTLEANYKTRTDFNTIANKSSTQITGLDVIREDQFSSISKYVKEGAFLNPSESGYIVIGSNLLERYSSFDTGTLLKGVYPGDTVKVTVNGATQEFIVKGILKSKVAQVSMRAFITQNDFLRIAGRDNLNVNEISLRHDTVLTDDQTKALLVDSGFGDDAKIQTATEAIPDFLNQIKMAFSVLGNMISAIGIVVASITIFIVIFINAITRRKFIGILKGIGVSPLAIQISYLIQSLFYALSGSIIGTVIIYGFLVPLFQKHPIDFPFSDGILVAEPSGTLIRFIILLIVTLIAGFIPARMIVRQNTLDSILGR